MKIAITLLLSFLLAIALSLGVALSALTVDAKEPPIILKDFPIIIACFNQSTGEFVAPRNESVEDGGCLIWPNMKNILLPSKSQMRLLKKVYGDRASIITAITLINHESQFNHKSKWCHNGGCDYGLLQIRDVNGGKNMTQEQQMQWLKTRKAHQMYNPKGTCVKTTAKGNQDNTLRCIFARHNGVLDFYAKYPLDRLREHKFYTKYFGSKKIVF